MPTYTLEQLQEEGPPYALAMLLRSFVQGEPFITYGAIRNELEYQLGIERIFPTQIGHVAGSMMDKILTIDPNAPLINVLITRGNGVPGKGAGWYLAERYQNPRLQEWGAITKEEKLRLVERERQLILQYKKWDAIYKKLFDNSAREKIRAISENEADYGGLPRGGAAESEEHKRLKLWVSNNPKKIGLSSKFGKGQMECPLESGDTVDVMFAEKNVFRAVEVKSIRSTDKDLKRGIYQCVKYREVKRAEAKPYESDIEAILVVERELPVELADRARLLNVKYKVVSVNTVDLG